MDCTGFRRGCGIDAPLIDHRLVLDNKTPRDAPPSVEERKGGEGGNTNENVHVMRRAHLVAGEGRGGEGRGGRESLFKRPSSHLFVAMMIPSSNGRAVQRTNWPFQIHEGHMVNGLTIPVTAIHCKTNQLRRVGVY